MAIRSLARGPMSGISTKRKALVASVAALAGVIGFSSPAHAASTSVYGSVSSYTTYYSTARTITASGSDIYLRVNPRTVDIKVFWYKCSDRNVRGAAVNFWSHESGRKLIGSNFRSGTSFCLAAAGDIGEGSRSWSGTLEWNVYS
ncbi:hypothetical protein [Streptomyces pratensis]|uniref:hypothetical protein n=1 Tax=Streptomyces pratensis TaxID=1169025 RepID=UPI00301A335B